ncbi:MAG: hypothetical protein IJ801_05865 [Lachnospiraceae bacterium]|nr:hypothetical protein [Lachnospiraceae bacterium]
MHIVEEDRYKVACHVDRGDLRLHGITMDDLINRTPLGRMFIQRAAELSKDSTEYEWPGCGFSMQMDFYSDDIVLVFSERIEDFVYNLQQTAHTLSAGQAEQLNGLLLRIAMAEEDEARQIIRSFENHVRTV